MASPTLPPSPDFPPLLKTFWPQHPFQQEEAQEISTQSTPPPTSTPTSPPQTLSPQPIRTMSPAGTSQSWTSPQATHAAKLQRLQNNASHLGFSASPFFPKNLGEYMRHQMEYADDLAEREREKLEQMVGERQSRKRVEIERVETRECVERILKGIGGVAEIEEESEGEVLQSHEEQLQEARAGKVKADDEAEVADAEIETKGAESRGHLESTEIEAEDAETRDHLESTMTEAAGVETRENLESTEIEAEGAESKGLMERTEVESSESADKDTATKKKSRKRHSGKGSKKKSKNPSEEPKSTTSKPAPSNKTRNTDELAKKLAASVLNDPLLRSVQAGTAKLPTSSLWKAFTQSPLYNPAGSGVEIGALMSQVPKPGYTPVLAAKTNVWSGNEQLKPEGKRDPRTSENRANWPDLSELKAEGPYRKEAGKARRFPLPRKDLMNREAVLAQMGDYEKLSEVEIEEKVTELEKKTGEDIPWYDREVVRYRDFDRLESISKERREDEKRRRMGVPIPGPHGANAGTSAQINTSPGGIGPGYQYGQTYVSVYQNRSGANMGGGLRGGYSNTGRGRGQPVPAQPKVTNPEAISYGADGPGDGEKPPPGGWVFDEEWLKQKGEWKHLLEKHL